MKAAAGWKEDMALQGEWLVLPYFRDLVHRVAKWLRLEGTSGDCLVQPPSQSRIIYSRFPWNCVQLGFEYLKGWRLQNHSMQFGSVSNHPHIRSFFLHCERISCVSTCVCCILSCH